MDRDDIGFLQAERIDALFSVDMAEGADAIAQGGGALEVEIPGGCLHVVSQRVSQRLTFPAEKFLSARNEGVVFLLVDVADAGRAAALDLVQQARTGPRFEDAVGARSQQKCTLQCVQCTVDRTGRGERPVVVTRDRLRAAMFDHLGKTVVGAQQDIGIGLVVAQRHVVARLQSLDQIGLKEQRFDL